MLKPTHLLDLCPVLGRLVRHLVDRQSPLPDSKMVLSPMLMIQVPLDANSGVVSEGRLKRRARATEYW